MKEEIIAQISDLIYTNESNYYTVLLFENEEEQFFAVGNMPVPKIGRRYRLRGEWKEHPKYGNQFAFSSFEELKPTTAAAIAAYLSSGIIKGIGPATARRIVKKFGDDTLKIIENEPERLCEVAGIGKIKANAIAKSYAEQTECANTVVELAKYEINSAVAIKLYKQYGSETMNVLYENPYRLIDDMYGIGFVRADKIAKSMGFAEDSAFRVQSGVIYAMEQYAEAGDSYMPEAEFTEKTAQFLNVEREQVAEAIFELVMDGRLRKENLTGENILMLYRFHKAECSVASKLYMLCNTELTGISGNTEALIKITENSGGIELSENQKNAVISSLKNGVSVITGGPGTGKTTIINTILAILKNEGIKTLLAAPTGRAAKRMSKAAGENAMTIHRMLEYGFSNEEEVLRFGKNEENPLDAGCIIIDEASMVDILLMEALLNAIKPGTRLLLVGDADQLPSVGAGNVLGDILECEAIHSVRLTEIFRQAQESMIVVNAHLINKGEYPSYNGKDSDFFMLGRKNGQEIAATIRQLCSERLPAYYKDFNPLTDIQVLTPTRRCPCGSVELNKILRETLNPPAEHKNEKLIGDRLYREGDKVIQNKNDYMLPWRSINSGESGEGVFNGDMGIVRSVDNEEGTITVIFDDERLVAYDYSIADELEAAFALTVHKSQGSEFPVVVMPISKFPPMLSTRNLLYTAVTRAKEGVVLVGVPAIVNAMVDNNFSALRHSGLKERLKKIWELY